MDGYVSVGVHATGAKVFCSENGCFVSLECGGQAVTVFIDSAAKAHAIADAFNADYTDPSHPDPDYNADDLPEPGAHNEGG